MPHGRQAKVQMPVFASLYTGTEKRNELTYMIPFSRFTGEGVTK